MKTDHVQYDRLRLKGETGETFENPRTHSGLEQVEIHMLATTIAYHGLLNPLRVTPNYVILAGQRRYLAIGYLREHGLALADELGVELLPLIEHIARLIAAVPIIIVDDDADLDGIAMADNLARVDLSSYEIAAEIARMHDRGATGVSIAPRIGKSPAYVSKALRAWRGASEALKEAWRDGLVSYDRVKELADLGEEEQERAIAGGKPRGGHGRPGIEVVKTALDEAEREYGSRSAPESYARAVIDALRWVSGQQSSSKFAEFMASLEDG